MMLPSPFSSVIKRAGLCAGLALLAGCATTSKRDTVEVSSPPPPRSGTQRIMAYDAYAAALFAPTGSATTATVAVSEPGDKRSINSTLD